MPLDDQVDKYSYKQGKNCKIIFSLQICFWISSHQGICCAPLSEGVGKIEVVRETALRENTNLQSGPRAEAQTPVFLTTNAPFVLFSWSCCSVIMLGILQARVMWSCHLKWNKLLQFAGLAARVWMTIMSLIRSFSLYKSFGFCPNNSLVSEIFQMMFATRIIACKGMGLRALQRDKWERGMC